MTLCLTAEREIKSIRRTSGRSLLCPGLGVEPVKIICWHVLPVLWQSTEIVFGVKKDMS